MSGISGISSSFQPPEPNRSQASAENHHQKEIQHTINYLISLLSAARGNNGHISYTLFSGMFARLEAISKDAHMVQHFGDEARVLVEDFKNTSEFHSSSVAINWDCASSIMRTLLGMQQQIGT